MGELPSKEKLRKSMLFGKVYKRKQWEEKRELTWQIAEKFCKKEKADAYAIVNHHNSGSIERMIVDEHYYDDVSITAIPEPVVKDYYCHDWLEIVLYKLSKE